MNQLSDRDAGWRGEAAGPATCRTLAAARATADRDEFTRVTSEARKRQETVVIKSSLLTRRRMWFIGGASGTEAHLESCSGETTPGVDYEQNRVRFRR